MLVYAIPNGGPVAMVWGWTVGCAFSLCIGLSIAELGSAAPTAGGLYFWTHSFSSPRWWNLLAWIVGYANTVGCVAAVASLEWGCANQITAAASIGSGQTYIATNGQTYGIFAVILLTHALLSSLATSILARLPNVYIALNILCAFWIELDDARLFLDISQDFVLQSLLLCPLQPPSST